MPPKPNSPLERFKTVQVGEGEMQVCLIQVPNEWVKLLVKRRRRTWSWVSPSSALLPSISYILQTIFNILHLPGCSKQLPFLSLALTLDLLQHQHNGSLVSWSLSCLSPTVHSCLISAHLMAPRAIILELEALWSTLSSIIYGKWYTPVFYK